MTSHFNGLVEFLAQRDRGNGKRYCTEARTYGDRDPLDMHRLGWAGELLWAEYLNVWPDLTPRASRIVKRPDLVYRGWSIDVKTVDHPTPKLMTPTFNGEQPMNIYALANRYGGDHLVGWLSSRELMTDQNRTDLGYGECWCVDAAGLRAPSQLKTAPQRTRE